MLHRSIDMLVTIGIAVVAVITVFVPDTPMLIRVAVVLPLVLCAPGYALVAAAFPLGALDIVERVLFSLGLSIIIVVLGGFALHWTTWGLQASTWVILLSGLTLGGCAVTLLRRHKAVPPDPARPSIRPTRVQALLLGLAGLITVGAVVVAVVGAEQPHTPGFTQLWAIPDDVPNMVRLGVENHEYRHMDYILRLEAQGQTLEAWPPISLESGERWEIATKLNINLLNYPNVTVMLYRQDVPNNIYRQVVLLPNTK